MSGKVIRVEVIAFFNRFPQKMCTCEEISEILQKPQEEVESQLESLVRLGLLERLDEGGAAIFRARAAYTGVNHCHFHVETRKSVDVDGASRASATEAEEVLGGWKDHLEEAPNPMAMPVTGAGGAAEALKQCDGTEPSVDDFSKADRGDHRRRYLSMFL